MTPRRELVEPNAPLSMRWQCELLGVNRSSLYYEPVEPDGEQLAFPGLTRPAISTSEHSSATITTVSKREVSKRRVPSARPW